MNNSTVSAATKPTCRDVVGSGVRLLGIGKESRGGPGEAATHRAEHAAQAAVAAGALKGRGQHGRRHEGEHRPARDAGDGGGDALLDHASGLVLEVVGGDQPAEEGHGRGGHPDGRPGEQDFAWVRAVLAQQAGRGERLGDCPCRKPAKRAAKRPTRPSTTP